jgi:Ca2+-binding RTX toxin-like protein
VQLGGGAGNDDLFGKAGNDRLYGQGGKADEDYGAAGDDFCAGEIFHACEDLREPG